MENTNKGDTLQTTDAVGVTETAKEQLNKIEREMTRCYDNWDDAVNNKQQPVSIQDLDFWRCSINGVLSVLEGGN